MASEAFLVGNTPSNAFELRLEAATTLRQPFIPKTAQDGMRMTLFSLHQHNMCIFSLSEN
ncbi:hypothetical protein G5S34_12160 [Herbaspirillum frisingense]|uniref:hypothetical protein n=1 Tax=Herbaspirillum frisingense TaxID=92645 RepID=UPI0013771BF4|nr:hypothetical protein [Herbaspirillum frisingense]QNB07450.1 hypothetical protein G5S34_12160 [Herbaspirillum frisingense]